MGLLGRWLIKQGPGVPVGHSALLRDGVTPHGEAHTDDGAGNEDQEDHKGTDQEVQEGIEEGATVEPREGAKGDIQGATLSCSPRHREGTHSQVSW